METYYTIKEIQEANFSYSFLKGKSCAESLNVLQNIDDKIPLSIIPKELHKYLKQKENMCIPKSECSKNNEYRPYKKEELPNLVGKVVIHKQDGSTSLIISTYKESISVGSGGLSIKSNVLLNDYTFKDGSVCGVKEEKFYSILELDVTKKYTCDVSLKGYIYYDTKKMCWFWDSGISVSLTDKMIKTKFKEYETIK